MIRIRKIVPGGLSLALVTGLAVGCVSSPTEASLSNEGLGWVSVNAKPATWNLLAADGMVIRGGQFSRSEASIEATSSPDSGLLAFARTARTERDGGTTRVFQGKTLISEITVTGRRVSVVSYSEGRAIGGFTMDAPLDRVASAEAEEGYEEDTDEGGDCTTWAIKLAYYTSRAAMACTMAPELPPCIYYAARVAYYAYKLITQC